jgi:hypothetical protein
MPSRSPAPGGYRLLEWGMSTTQPRSLVLDGRSTQVFTGSPVRTGGRRKGRVVELVSVRRVVVRWEEPLPGEPELETVDAKRLIVTGPRVVES